ncbi:MAG: rRNA methylase-like protein [Sedimentibacter sp.]|jgi:TrmH family RNA methyltransferase|nr:rRNA methylase-like protein [Sedimentibacter sp.]
MDLITSKDNLKIKYVRSLSAKKFRDQENSFVVEGIKFVREAITEKANISFVLFSESALDKSEAKAIEHELNNVNAEIITCTDNVFDSAADTINAQGVLAVIKKNDTDDLKLLKDFKFAVMCDRIQDPGNLGTIIRTADAFGPAAVIMNKGCVDEYNPKVVRASAGAIFRGNFIHGDDEEIISGLYEQGFKVYSTVVESDFTFEDIEKSEKICVVIGNEGQGVSREIVDASSMNITIKMSGRAESLNASIAAGISIYEIRKKLL